MSSYFAEYIFADKDFPFRHAELTFAVEKVYLLKLATKS